MNLDRALAELGLDCEVIEIQTAPQVTRHLVTLGHNGKAKLRAGKLIRSALDLSIALGVDNVQVVPVPEQYCMAIEVPRNGDRIFVHLYEVMRSKQFIRASYDMTLPVVLGVGLDNQPVIVDLATLPHLLVAGTTGSGKSILTRCIIESLRIVQDSVKFLLIDPKRVELADYRDDPKVLRVVTDSISAKLALVQLANTMDDRYALFEQAGVKNIDEYPKPLDRCVVVIDELSDLMIQVPGIESKLVRLAQLGRAAGIHLVIATQYPKVDVVTGLIKANFAARVGLKVATRTNSRVILDQNGAEGLLGKGDLLYKDPQGDVKRVQGCYV